MSFEIVADTDADDDGGLPTGTAGYGKIMGIGPSFFFIVFLLLLEISTHVSSLQVSRDK